MRCASAKRRPAHAMSKIPPIKSTSCSGADPLQIQSSHCTSAAKGTGNASSLRAPETTSCRKSVMSANDSLAGVKRAFLGPFRLTECTCSGRGNALAAVGVQVLATRSQKSCASMRRCSSRARASSCFSGKLRACCRPSSERTCREQRRLLHRTQTFHLQTSLVIWALLGVSLGRARCVA